jgi:hypothetical protein
MPEIEKIANTQRNPMRIDLARLPTNDDFASNNMPWIRVAACVVKLSKAKVISFVQDCDRQDPKEIDNLLKNLSETQREFAALAQLCAAAEVRLANSMAVGVAKEKRAA